MKILRRFTSQILAALVSLVIIVTPVPFRANVLDSDMRPQREYIYTSTICGLDQESGRTVLNMRGRTLVDKDILLVGYIVSRDEGVYITNMPGLVTTEDLRYLGVFEVPLKGDVGLAGSSDGLTPVSIVGNLEFMADNDFSFYVKTVTSDGLIVPRHTTEYLLFNWQYYTLLIGYLDEYYTNIKDSGLTNEAVEKLTEIVEGLGGTTYKNTDKLKGMLDQLIQCYRQPEIIDREFISRSEQLAAFKVTLIEELIRWGSLHGEKLGFTQ